jgi:hypothetical protein
MGDLVLSIERKWGGVSIERKGDGDKYK